MVQDLIELCLGGLGVQSVHTWVVPGHQVDVRDPGTIDLARRPRGGREGKADLGDLTSSLFDVLFGSHID